MGTDETKTLFYDLPSWISPVESRDDLPTEDVDPDTLCFVEQDGAVYRFHDGRWLIEAAPNS